MAQVLVAHHHVSGPPVVYLSFQHYPRGGNPGFSTATALARGIRSHTFAPRAATAQVRILYYTLPSVYPRCMACAPVPTVAARGQQAVRITAF